MEEVTKELLIKNGFKETNIHDIMPHFELWTDDKPAWKLDVHLHEVYNNTMKEHYVHIDNDACSTAGSLEFDNIEQFNYLMMALGTKFRLKV